ncbi:MAG: hypothetical protein ACREF4_10380, partial [Gammaproteobacteria bacterium]
MRRRRILIAAALLATVPAAAPADQRANAPTTTGETGLFTLFSGQTVPRGEWSFGIYYNNWDRVFEFDDTADLDWNRLSASVGYGITEAFELTLSVPYEDLDPDFPGQVVDSESGFGNARLAGKWRLTGDPYGANAFAINAFVELPTGDEEVLGGDTGFGAGLDWSAGNWVFDLGYRVPGDVNDLELSDEALAGLGYAGRVSENLDWITELVGTFPLDSDEALFEESVDLATGGRLWFGETGEWAFNFGLRTDVLQLSETDDHCPIGGLLGLTYFPRLVKPEP